ncbi:MAG: sulfotransferase family 2 domain-containing protein [Nocardioides sp.]
MPHAPHPSTFLSVPGNTWVLPEHKVVYVSATKVACTTLKWMVADLAGEDHAQINTVASGMQSRLMTIHPGRSRFEHVRAVHQMPAEEVATINPDNGWFVFAALRDPWSRLWSAWQSKFLVRANRYVRNYADAPFFPRVPERPSDVVEDFARFVELRPWLTDPRMQKDLHFQPQVQALQPEQIPYSRIYDLRDFSSMTSDLHTHLEALGKDQELYVPRANETPLGLTRAAMGGGVKEAVEELYPEDFAAFGERWDFERLKFTADGWTPDAIAHAAYQIDANDWIGQVWASAKDWRDERNTLARRNARLEHRLAKVRRRVRRLRARH